MVEVEPMGHVQEAGKGQNAALFVRIFSILLCGFETQHDDYEDCSQNAKQR
jgi:hypothetical protein